MSEFWNILNHVRKDIKEGNKESEEAEARKSANKSEQDRMTKKAVKKLGGKVKESLSREEWDVVKEAASDVALNFQTITKTDPVTLIDLEGQFYQDVIDKTIPAVQAYVFKKYSDIAAEGARGQMWEEFLYVLDEELMEKYTDAALEKAGGFEKVYWGKSKESKEAKSEAQFYGVNESKEAIRKEIEDLEYEVSKVTMSGDKDRKQKVKELNKQITQLRNQIEEAIDLPGRDKTVKGVMDFLGQKRVNENVTKDQIIKDIMDGTDLYFGYAHFDSSNMADYTLMSTTISDMVSVYGIREEEAAEIVQELTHDHDVYKKNKQFEVERTNKEAEKYQSDPAHDYRKTESKVNEGKEERGKRDGTGPYKSSRIRQAGFSKGRRKQMGQKCPNENPKEINTDKEAENFSEYLFPKVKEQYDELVKNGMKPKKALNYVTQESKVNEGQHFVDISAVESDEGAEGLFEEMQEELLAIGIADGEHYYLGNGPEMIFLSDEAYESSKEILRKYNIELDESKVNEDDSTTETEQKPLPEGDVDRESAIMDEPISNTEEVSSAPDVNIVGQQGDPKSETNQSAERNEEIKASEEKLKADSGPIQLDNEPPKTELTTSTPMEIPETDEKEVVEEPKVEKTEEEVIESKMNEVTAKEHNQRPYDTYITPSRHSALEKYLVDKMKINYHFAKQLIKSYELKTAVNGESVKLIDAYIQHREPEVVGKRKVNEVLDDEGVTHLHSMIEGDEDDLIAIANTRLGWAVAEQLRDILGGEPLEAQNSNALDQIKDFLAQRGEDAVASEIEAYLTKEAYYEPPKSKIVKGGKSVNFPFGSYRTGYDIVQRESGKFYMSIVNGPFEIFTGPDADTAEEAESLGIEKVKNENPTLARNTGIGESSERVHEDWDSLKGGIVKESPFKVAEMSDFRSIFEGARKLQEDQSTVMFHGENFGEYIKSHDLDCELIIADAESQYGFVWNKGDDLTPEGKIKFADILNSSFDVLENGNIIVNAPETAEMERLGDLFVAAAAGYIPDLQYKKWFITESKLNESPVNITTPDLASVDLNKLDPIEQNNFKYYSKSGKMSKEEILQVIINTVEGDFTQLSDELRIRAEKDPTFKDSIGEGKSKVKRAKRIPLKLVRKPSQMSKDMGESKLTEDGLTGPNSTTFVDAGSIVTPEVPAEPKKVEPIENPEESNPKEEKDEEAVEGEKEYVGKKGNDEFFYLVLEPNNNEEVTVETNESKVNEGNVNLQITTSDGEVVLDAKEVGVEPSDVKAFLMKAMDSLEMTELSVDVVNKYILAPEEEEAPENKEMTKTPEGEESIKSLGEEPKTEEETKESKVNEAKYTKYSTSFTMVTEPNCSISGPREMLEKDAEDGGELGFQISDIKINRVMSYNESKVNEDKIINYKGSKVKIFKYGDGWTWSLPGTHNSYGAGGVGPTESDTPGEATQEAKDYIDSMDESKVVEGLLEKFGLDETAQGKINFQNKLITLLAEVEGTITLDEIQDAVDKVTQTMKYESKVSGLLDKFGLNEDITINEIKAKVWYGSGLVEKLKMDIADKYTVEYESDRMFLYIKPVDIVESLLEKFQLNEQEPATEEKPKEDVRDQDLTGVEVKPEDVEEELPAEGQEVPVDEPINLETPVGGEGEIAEPIEDQPASKQDYSSPEAAEAQIRLDYVEEPYTTTALVFADSLISDPQVYAGVRKQNWDGIYTDSKTFLQQAKIVGDYGSFNSSAVKAIVDRIGEGEKYKLAREIRPVVYATVRDGSANFSLSELKGASGAKEVIATTNPGEAKFVF